MSRKANRLKNRIRIEHERIEKQRKEMDGRAVRLANAEAVLRREKRDLERSVAMRMRVERSFSSPAGPCYQIVTTFYPYEFKIASRHNPVFDATYWAGMKGHEVGKQVSDVLLRCMKGELEAFENAR